MVDKRPLVRNVRGQNTYSPTVAGCKLLILKGDFGGEGGIRTASSC